MAVDPSSAAIASDALRSELIFIGSKGSVESHDDAGQSFVVIRTPDNPTYWWGNTLHFATPPVAGDLERWNALFERHVSSRQPLSSHRTFGWDGELRGVVEPFVERGYEYFEMLVLAADPSTRIAAPHPAPDRVSTLVGGDWLSLRDMLVDTRDESKHSLEGYGVFVDRRIEAWRALAEAGRGAWFGAWDAAGRIASALGVFVEAEPGADGRRIGRFQHVATRVEARRRGLAGTLVATASRHAFEVLGADTLLILADENDEARRVYESVGFVRAGRQRGLELGRY